MTSGASASGPSERRVALLSARARRLLPLFLLILVALSVRRLWCAEAGPVRLELSGASMGTTWSVTLADPGLGAAQADAARAVVEKGLARINALMSTWDPDSEISRLNRHAWGDPFPVSPETLDVLEIARQVSERSDGAFDVTVGPLVAAWGFGASARLPAEGPDPRELVGLRERVGFRLLAVDGTAGTVTKRRRGVECDLSAIAKGYAVDQLVRALQALGHARFLVEVGGEVFARGERPGGGPWHVAIEAVDAEGRMPGRLVALQDRAMATSGDYRSFYERGGERVPHFIDPRTGRPTRHGLASVSVVHASATWADAWATALSVLGPEAAPVLARAEGLAAYFVVRVPGTAPRVFWTPAFEILGDAAAGASAEPARY